MWTLKRRVRDVERGGMLCDVRRDVKRGLCDVRYGACRSIKQGKVNVE